MKRVNAPKQCVTIKKHDDIYHHYGASCTMSIVGCDESNIYVDSSVETLDCSKSVPYKIKSDPMY
jgi:hypothetical protein